MRIFDINVDVKRKKIKKMYLRVQPPDGKAYVSAPYGVPDNIIRSFAENNYIWLKRQITSVRNSGNVIKYKDGERIYLWGNDFSLRIFHGEKRCISIKNEIIEICVKGDECVEKQLIELYRREMIKAAPPLIRLWETKLNVKSNSLTVRNMRTRWGTCNYNTKKITINLFLAQKDIKFTEYIVLHELAHLIEPNHSKAFYRIMDKFMPDWSERRAILNGRQQL